MVVRELIGMKEFSSLQKRGGLTTIVNILLLVLRGPLFSRPMRWGVPSKLVGSPRELRRTQTSD